MLYVCLTFSCLHFLYDSTRGQAVTQPGVYSPYMLYVCLTLLCLHFLYVGTQGESN